MLRKIFTSVSALLSGSIVFAWGLLAGGMCNDLACLETDEIREADGKYACVIYDQSWAINDIYDTSGNPNKVNTNSKKITIKKYEQKGACDSYYCSKSEVPCWGSAHNWSKGDQIGNSFETYSKCYRTGGGE